MDGLEELPKTTYLNVNIGDKRSNAKCKKSHSLNLSYWFSAIYVIMCSSICLTRSMLKNKMNRIEYSKHIVALYQGEGSSHKLAALLQIEVIHHSLPTLKLPAFAIFLDAKLALTESWKIFSSGTFLLLELMDIDSCIWTQE